MFQPEFLISPVLHIPSILLSYSEKSDGPPTYLRLDSLVSNLYPFPFSIANSALPVSESSGSLSCVVYTVFVEFTSLSNLVLIYIVWCNSRVMDLSEPRGHIEAGMNGVVVTPRCKSVRIWRIDQKCDFIHGYLPSFPQFSGFRCA